MSVTQRQYDTTPSVLFAVLVNPDTYPQWLVGAKRIRSVDADWPAKGSTFRHVVGFGPIAIADSTTVTRIDQDRMLELIVRARPTLEAKVRFEIGSEPNGCLLTMTEDPIGVHRWISPLAQPLIRARNEKSLDRLAQLVERTSAT